MHLVGSFYEIYITMHGSMNIKFTKYGIEEETKISFICSTFRALIRWTKFIKNTNTRTFVL